MKWRRRPDYPRPKSGDKRTRIKFAWWPTAVGGDLVVWLEFYFIEERWNEDGEDLDYPSSHGARIVATGAAWRRLRTFAQPKT